MKKIIRSFLKKLGLLEKIRFNHWYRMSKQKEFRINYLKQFDFYSGLLGNKSKLVFDIGANIGDYAYLFSKIADKVVTVEPDEHSGSILHSRFANNKRITVVQKAVSSKEGEAKFYVEASGSAFNTLSDKWVDVLENKSASRFESEKKFEAFKKVQTTTLDSLIKEYGKPDFIKIDVEGFESEVIKGLTHPVPLLSFECNLPEFLNESISIVEYLNTVDNGYRFNYIDEYSFLLPGFVKADEMIAILKKTELRYFEIFCKLN